ncbi:DNA replication and repair protein RadC [Caldanaerobius fijiensis DSM 17918]|uniref:DNA replication and repair protein RadC n=2 Tax=Caldanaerobius TaxID=862261 RepID=A0A1M4Y958_9THEO|nr:DNA replication and repair protein RadC [Caldanaerobius fijiensis DSM 17918]
MDAYNIAIKDMPSDERPRERMLKYGPEVLSNVELLAIIIRTGTKNESAIKLAERLLNRAGEDGLKFLLDSSLEELSKIKGVGLAKAAELKAAIELGIRVQKAARKIHTITKPQDIADLLMVEMRYLKKEVFKIVLLNVKNQVISIENISIGNLNSSIVHPREIFNAAIRKYSASIILVHNHPSGDPTPSMEDINVTKRIIEGGKILGIDVLDHIVIGDGTYVSMKQKNII